MSSVKTIKKASSEIAKANSLGWGSIILQQIIERGIRDMRSDQENYFNINVKAVQEVIEILESHGISDKNLDPVSVPEVTDQPEVIDIAGFDNNGNITLLETSTR